MRLVLPVLLFLVSANVHANCEPQEVVEWSGVGSQTYGSASAACQDALAQGNYPNLQFDSAQVTGVEPYQSAACLVKTGRFIVGQGYVFDDQSSISTFTTVTQVVTVIPCNEETCNAGETFDLSYQIDPNASLSEISNLCYGGCSSSIIQVYDEWELADGTYVIATQQEKTGAECTDSPPNNASGDTSRPSDANAGNPRDENGQPCTGEYYTGPGGDTICGSPDDPDPNTNNPDSTVDNSCFGNPSSCTDTNGDGTPDTPTGCEAGQSCTDTNGDGVPDTPTGGSTNGDGSANNDGNPDTEQSSDGSGKECLPSQMTYDGKCPSDTGPSGDCPSNEYELVNGVSVCKSEATGTGSSATVSGGTTCDKAPQCSGDPVGCAQLYQQWKIRCAAGVEDVKAEDFLNGNIDQQYESMEKTIRSYAEESPFGDPLTMRDFFSSAGGGCTWSMDVTLLNSSFADNGRLCDMVALFKMAMSILVSGYVAITIFETFASTVPG